MATCPQCGATVSDDATFCSNCKTELNLQTTTRNKDAELAAQLQKLMRQNEILTYAAAGLAIAILAVIIGIAFL
jgi:uncharacterized membrane protein YvbJ